jgi:5-methylcytosine-specific restriction protein A
MVGWECLTKPREASGLDPEAVHKPECQLDKMGNYSLDNHFCDKGCETAFKQSEWVGEGHPKWEGGDDEVVCEECGDTFSVRPAKSDDAMFCSVKCWSESHYSHVPCDNCGESYKRSGHLIEKTEHNICSDECFSEWWSEQQRGSGNTSYKTEGGKAGIAVVRRSIGDIAWDRRARQVRERDNHTCQQCGKQPDDRVLDVHHIVPIASGGTSAPANLIALCRSCHRTAEAYTEQFVGQYLFALTDPDN